MAIRCDVLHPVYDAERQGCTAGLRLLCCNMLRSCMCVTCKLAAVHHQLRCSLTMFPTDHPLQNWEDEDIPVLLKSIEEELRGRIQVRCCASRRTGAG